MKPSASRGFGTKTVLGANFVSTSPNVPSSKLPSTIRPLDSAPLVVTANLRPPHVSPQVPPLKSLSDLSQDIDVPDAMPWHNGETAHDYTMHLLALSGSDAFVTDSDHVADAKKQETQKGSKFLKIKGAVLANSFLHMASKKPVRAENPRALASFKVLSAMSEEEKLLYPSWMTEGDIQTRKFLAQKIVANRNRMTALLIRADEMIGTDDLRETLAKKYGLNEATYTEVADMVSNNRTKVKTVFDDIHALSQEQQAVLQEVQRALASTTTDLNFEISNLEDRLDDLQEDSLLQDAERSLGHAKSMRIRLSTSHSRFLDQAVERLTTKMPQVVKTKHMEQDLVLAADSLETMRKTVQECKASTLKAQKEAQEKNEVLKLCQKELSEVSKDRDRLVKVEKELRSTADNWREKFYQSDRDLNMEIRRSEDAERQHAAILEITLKNAQKVVEDRIAATARAHEDQVRKLNTILVQLEHDLVYEKKLRDPDAVLKNADNLTTQQKAAKSVSIVQQLEDSQSENEALQRTVDRLISEVNSASDDKEALDRQIAGLMLQIKSQADESNILMEEHASKKSEMQVHIDSMSLIIKDANAKNELHQSQKDDFEKTILQAQQEILMLKSQISLAKVSKQERMISIGPEKGSTHSIGTQTLSFVDTASTTKIEATQADLKPENEKMITNDVVEQTALNPESSDRLLPPPFAIKRSDFVVKVLCGTQTDVPYPQTGFDHARFAIDCTRPECLIKIKEIQQLKELAIATSNSEAQEAASKLANQLAMRDREHKSSSQKIRKEMDIRLAFERDNLLKVQNQFEQFRGAVKKKVEATIMEIKKMKRIGDFSNVGEIELHLNDVYIGATENFDSFQAEIEARNQEASETAMPERDSGSAQTGHENINYSLQSSDISSSKETKIVVTKNSKLGAASKAIMFTKAAGKALNSFGGNSSDVTNSNGSSQSVSVSVDDLKTTAERFIYSTQQFISGCSFGVNSSSVSLERAQKKLSICVEHFRERKKASLDSIFQLNLDLKDFKQKYEDSQMVVKSQAAALARTERDCRFLAQRLSKHEEVETSLENGDVDDSPLLQDSAGKKASKSSSNNSKLSMASKAVMFTKTSSKGMNASSKSDSKSTAKLSGRDSSNIHQTVPSATCDKSGGETPVSDTLGPDALNSCQLDVFGEQSNSLIVDASLQPLITNENLIDSSEPGLNASEMTNERDTDGKSPAETDKRKVFRRHLDELKLSTVSCIYQESSDVPVSLNFATQVELGSLRSAHKSHEAKIRKLEQLLVDKQDQLQHFAVMMESSSRDQLRSRNYAMDLSLEVHLERSKLETQLECNAELLRKIATLDDKLKKESQTLAAVRVQESDHVKKLEDLTEQMHTFYQRCENYVHEERSPLLALFFEFWLRLGLLRKDIGMIFSNDSSDVCNFRSSVSDLSNYSSQDSTKLVASFTEMLAHKSLSQLRDEIILKFGLCCSDLVGSLNAYNKRQQPALEKKADSTILLPVAQSILHPVDPVLSNISKDSKYPAVSLPISSQFSHKQLLPSISPKHKMQSFDSIAIDDALHRNSDVIVEKLISKFLKGSGAQDIEVSQKLLNSWAKLATAGCAVLKPENFHKTHGFPSLSPLTAPAAAHKSPPVLFPIQEEM